MKIYSPDNYFSRLFFDAAKKEVSFLPASLVTTEIIKDPDSIGLIPVMDILKHQDLFVSKSYGVSFEESLCNTFIYYGDSKKINEFVLTGDVSSVEAVLSKILFKEMYDTDIILSIDLAAKDDTNKNLIKVGNNNFLSGSYTEGISFSEEIIEIINLPFVNYVLASVKKENLEKFHKEAQLDNFELQVEESIIKIIPPESRDFFLNNIASLVVKFDEQDVEGIDQIVSLPFYHGLIKDLFKIKFV